MTHSIFTSNKLNQAIDNILNSSLSDIVGTDFVKNSPSVNITENDTQHNIIIAAPGYEKSDFTITVENDQLAISTEVEIEEKEEDTFLRREFSFTNFKRSFHLPNTIDRENISATYTEGILNITVLKKDIHNKENGRTVEIV